MDLWIVFAPIMAFGAGLAWASWVRLPRAPRDLRAMNRRYADILMVPGEDGPWIGGEDIRLGDQVIRVEVYVRKLRREPV